jgi:ribonuclease BN (tRNA processing enzyme)
VKLTLIPSTVGSGPHSQFLSSCLVNDTVALDAGCLGMYRTPQDQARVRHVLLSHTHIDHLASLPVFIENAYEGRAESVIVHGSAAVLDTVQRDLFNDRLWPDFIALSQGDKPFLRLSPLEAGQTLEVEGLRITPVALDHVVPTVGFLLSDDQCSVAFVSDTGPTEEIWQQANALPNLQAVFLEATFPNDMAWLADVSKHLTPATFAAEVRKLIRPVRLFAIHLKARFQEQVAAELLALGLPNLEVARFDQPYEF